MDGKPPAEDPRSNPLGDSPQPSDPEENLDSLLAEASALATEVSEELGRAEEIDDSDAGDAQRLGPTLPDLDPTSESRPHATKPSDDIENQLTQVDSLLHDAAVQIGAEPTPADEVQQDEGKPPKPESTSKPAITKPEAAGSKPGQKDSALTATLPPPAPTEADLLGDEFTTPNTGNTAATVHQKAAPASPRVPDAVMNACEKGVNVLEKLDAPFHWLGAKPRRILGWVGLVTLALSLIALAKSFF